MDVGWLSPELALRRLPGSPMEDRPEQEPDIPDENKQQEKESRKNELVECGGFAESPMERH